jgi:hypothetical protein
MDFRLLLYFNTPLQEVEIHNPKLHKSDDIRDWFLKSNTPVQYGSILWLFLPLFGAILANTTSAEWFSKPLR